MRPKRVLLFFSLLVAIAACAAQVQAPDTPAGKQFAAWLQAFDEHLRTAGPGHISEIADAEPPHHPRGCIAQAWSVAELLRAAVEDVYELPVSGTSEAAVAAR